MTLVPHTWQVGVHTLALALLLGCYKRALVLHKKTLVLHMRVLGLRSWEQRPHMKALEVHTMTKVLHR